MIESIQRIIDLLGPTILVPVVVFILALFLRVETRKAFTGALFMGLGLFSFNIILGSLVGGVAPLVELMVDTIGLKLPAIDVGWPGAAVIVYANRIGMLYLPFGLGLNLLLFLTKWTDTFQPTDIWNYYQFVFWAAIVEVVTGSLFLAIACAAFLNLVILLIADWIAPSMQEFYGYDGVTSTCFAPIQGAPFAVLVQWVFKKLGIDRIDLKPEKIRERFGFWGEPAFLGVVVGFLIAFFALIKSLGSVETWATILSTAILTGAIMVLYPSVSGLFVKGLIPISQTLNARLRSGEIKRDNFNIGIDPAVFFGHESTLTSGLILIPIVLLISLIPGNIVLPLADLPAMPFMVIGMVIVMKGNILTTVLGATLWFILGNLANSNIAPIFTQAALAAGANIPAEAAMVTSWTIGMNPIAWVVYQAFAAPENIRIFTIILAVAVYLAIYVLFRKNRRKFYMAAGASEEFLDNKGIAVEAKKAVKGEALGQ